MLTKLYLSIFIIFVCTSCASIDSSRYEKFAEVVVETNSSAEKAVISAEEVARNGSIKRLASESNAKLGGLFVSTHDDAWKMESAPLYMELKNVRLQVISMNRTFEAYVDLLVELSGSKVLKRDELVVTGKLLNKNSENLAKTLKANIPEKGFQILSAAAMASLESYIDKKRESYLSEAIKKNQSSVESYVNISKQLIEILRSITRRSYSESFNRISSEWRNGGNRQSLARELFDLNDSFIMSLKLFKEIEDSYESLSKAHLELSKKNNDSSFSSQLRTLSKEANRFSTFQKKIQSKDN